MIPQEHNNELLALISKHAVRDGLTQTKIPGVSLFRSSVMDVPVPYFYNQCLCIIVQGEKEVMLDNEIYRYMPSQYLTVSVDLPLMYRITKASRAKPALLMKIDIDLKLLSELLLHTNLNVGETPTTKRGIFVGEFDKPMHDSVLRLARLMNSPADIPALATQTMREVLYRALCNDYGDVIAQIARKGSRMESIANAIRKLKKDFRQTITVEELAEVAHMSVSSFHSHFKSVTAMSPLQFQKSLRLIEARSIMISQDIDVANAAFWVGYQSPSQFSREYARKFGRPPARDVSIIRQQQSETEQ
ncbi:AraC family transcriptional regulator [Flavobacterium macacae]|uniref:AraC family transcriptional regulator n=1 Tax=Flavobacterium macacae TaxID=2488993 RepID=A0A3P3WAZ8_9FLAO|nr:AraC family transcriptional regulator [Flavobacterium macacae]RRJ90779.1 AraC family transcriptional regulator [Flavobacterium macacae]